MISISDNVGHIRSDFSDEEIASLTDEQREALTEVIRHAHSVETAEQEGRGAEASAAKCAKALADAEAKYHASLPKWDRIDEVRKMAEQRRRLALGISPLPPVKVIEDPKLVAAVRKAETAHNIAKVHAANLKEEIRTKRAALAESVKAWQTSHAITPEQHYREHLARQQAFYQKIAEGEIETADDVEHCMSHLDAVMQSGRRRGSVNSVNHGYTRAHAKRGTRVKLPSQR